MTESYGGEENDKYLEDSQKQRKSKRLWRREVAPLNP